MSNRSSVAYASSPSCVLLEVELDAPAVVGEVRERRLSVRAPRHDAAGDAHGLALVLLPFRLKRDRRGAPWCVRSNEYANGAMPRSTSASSFSRRARWTKFRSSLTPRRSRFRDGVPSDERYASINGSMSPSMTRLHVGNLQLCAVIVDHRVRLEDVAADLAAEAHVALRRIQLRFLLRLLLRLELIEPVLQLLHRRRLVLVLRPLGLRRRDDARRDVRQSHRGARLVHVLAAGARRAEHIHPDVLVADLDVDLVVDHRIHERRREARVPSRLRVERRDAHEAMHACFRLEEAVGVQALDLEHGALDARLFALAQIEDLDHVALSLGPARVHAHEHLRPVLRLGPAGAGADLELRIAEIVRARRAAIASGTLRSRCRVPTASRSTSADSSSSGSDASISSSSLALWTRPLIAVERFEPALQRLHLLHDSLRCLLVAPEAGRRHALLELPQRVSLGIQVKGTS